MSAGEASDDAAFTMWMAERYANLGTIERCTPLTFDFKVSNRLYEVITSQGRFIAKRMVSSDALYGQDDSARRLEAVARVVTRLRSEGLPVERIMPTVDGSYVARRGAETVRVFEFEAARAYSGSAADVARSAKSLRRLHREGIALLDDTLASEIGQAKSPYPLEQTHMHLGELRAFLADDTEHRAAFAPILEQWSTVEWAVREAVGYVPRTPSGLAVVHADFHPRNVLYRDDRDEATMLDLDNLIIDRPFKCLGFSILRFAYFGQRDRDPAVLEAALPMWVSAAELRDPAFVGDLAHAMLSLEAEKIVRILYRYRTTGSYFQFVENIIPIHLPNLVAVRPLLPTKRSAQ
jgi:Ser/Thr protein kinase RdoA (MazF antagonist)